MDPTPAQIPRLSARLAGGLVATAIVLVLAAVVLVRPFGFEATAALEQPELVAGGLLIAGGLGWGVGRAASSGGWLRSVGVGALLGLALWPVFVLLAILVSVVDAVIRGAAGPFDGVGAGLVWGLYGMVVIGLFVSVVTVPLGILWGLLTWAIVRRWALGPGGRRTWSSLLIGLVALSMIGGAAQANGTNPTAAYCRPMGEGYVVDAAFSPAGDLLAVATQTDPNEPGTILLLDWPSGEELARWQGWIDEEVTVSPSGEVYWSAWILGLYPAGEDGTGISEGVYIARPGSDPEWFATGFETPLNDLTWTTDGLRGTTPNSHRISSLEAGDTAPNASGDEVSAFWASADGQWTATGPAWEGASVMLTGPSRTTDVRVPGDQRSIAFTSDRSTLVAASWFNGTRAIDVATGDPRLIIRGSQRFVALSSLGDLAWANEEDIGDSQLCTAPLADL